MKWFKKGALVKSLRACKIVLHKSDKKKSLYILIALIFNSLLDLFSLASIPPLFFLLLNPNYIEKNEFVNAVYEFGNFNSFNSFILLSILLVLSLFIAKNILSSYIIKQQASFAFSFSANLTSRIYNNFFNENLIDLKNGNLANYSHQIVTIPGMFAKNILLALFTLLSEAVITVLIVSGLMLFNSEVFFLLLVLLFPSLIILYLTRKKKLQEINKRLSKNYPLSLKKTIEVIKGFITIKTLQKEQFFKKNFSRINSELHEDYSTLHTLESTSSKFLESIAMLSISILFIYSIYALNDRAEILILVGIFASAAYRLMPSINRIFVAGMQIKSHQYVVKELLDQKFLSYRRHDKKLPEIDFKEVVTFSNVHFNYPTSSFSLKNLNFSINKGDSIGLVGKSGSGKTTLVNLLLRFLEPNDGNIEIDGSQLNRYDANSWRKHFAYVPQEPFIIDSTIKENIALGITKNEIDLEKVNNVISMVSLDDLIESLPNGIETNIGEDGSKISGGQKQRIVLARALYDNKDIFLFDEITSQLDQHTKETLLQSIKDIINHDKTAIFITHDTEVLKINSRVFKIENGVINEVNKDHAMGY